MIKAFITTICIIFCIFNSNSQSKKEIIELYQRYVFLDQNFEFDGKVLKWPDTEKSYELSSTCYEVENPLDEELKYFDCTRKPDSRDYNVIFTDKYENNFTVSHVNFFGIKNTLKKVKTKSITTTVSNGKIDNQLMCDFKDKNKSLHVEIIDCECFLITDKTCELFTVIKDSLLSSQKEPYQKFIDHISSEEYRNLFIKKSKRAYFDIYASINNNRLRHRYFQNRIFDINQFKSPYDLIKERENQLSVKFETFNDLKKEKDLIVKLGMNMISKCWRIEDLWNNNSTEN